MESRLCPTPLDSNMKISTRQRSNIGMNTHHSSSVPQLLPLKYYVPRETVRRIIKEHTKSLYKKLAQIKEFNKMKKNTYLTMAERDFLGSGTCVLNQIKGLVNLATRLKSTKNHPLILVNERIQKLYKKQASIAIAEEHLSLGKSLHTKYRNVLCFKSVFTHEMDMLKNIIREISLLQFPLTRDNLGKDVEEYQSAPLMSELSRKLGIMSFDDSLKMRSLQKGKSSMKSSWRALATIFFDSTRDIADKSTRKSIGERCKAIRNLQFRPNTNGNVTRGFKQSVSVNETREVIDRVEAKHRYLCMNTGLKIFCLDLKQSTNQTLKNAHDAPLIPMIAILDLVKENLPAYPCLFKWGSNAYITGGMPEKRLKTSEKVFPQGLPWCPSLTYGMCLDVDVGIVSFCESNLLKLKKAKFWPIVEKINGQIHVIDSAPAYKNPVETDWLFSHEVFNSDNGNHWSWAEEIPTILPTKAIYLNYINSYLVLEKRIYALGNRAPLLFDSDTKKWETYPAGIVSTGLKDLHGYKNVWQILRKGHARCVGTFQYERGGDNPPLYVLIALLRSFDGDSDPMYAAACLVTSTGLIVCIQRLCSFFKGPVWPWDMGKATIIQVDDDMLCSVVKANPCEVDSGTEFLFINTFHVEMLSGSVTQTHVSDEASWPIEQEFVLLHTKDRHIFRLGTELKWGLNTCMWAGIQAYFL